MPEAVSRADSAGTQPPLHIPRLPELGLVRGPTRAVGADCHGMPAAPPYAGRHHRHPAHRSPTKAAGPPPILRSADPRRQVQHASEVLEDPLARGLSGKQSQLQQLAPVRKGIGRGISLTLQRPGQPAAFKEHERACQRAEVFVRIREPVRSQLVTQLVQRVSFA